MNNNLLDPKMDFIFKRIFGNENDPSILIRFLNAIFKSVSTGEYDPIVSIILQNTEIPKASIEDKYSLLDVRATTDKGEIIDIEIQKEDKKDTLKRSIFYLDKMYEEQIESGETYSKLRRVVSIMIMDYNTDFIKSPLFHNAYRFKNIKTNEELTDLQELHYIELKKMHFSDEDDELQLFLEFLKNPTSQIVEIKSHEIKELSKAKEKLGALSRDPNTRAEFDMREKALKDKASELESVKEIGIAEGLEKGIAEGLEKGIAEGLEKGKIETIRNCFNNGLDIKVIASIVNLTEERVKLILSNNNLL